MKREELLQLRDQLIRGNPPYWVDDMKNLRRERGGTRGIDELKMLGDHNPDSASLRMALDTCLKLVDHLLERMR